jgi:hypothetical protein
LNRSAWRATPGSVGCYGSSGVADWEHRLASGLALDRPAGAVCLAGEPAKARLRRWATSVDSSALVGRTATPVRSAFIAGRSANGRGRLQTSTTLPTWSPRGWRGCRDRSWQTVLTWPLAHQHSRAWPLARSSPRPDEAKRLSTRHSTVRLDPNSWPGCLQATVGGMDAKFRFGMLVAVLLAARLEICGQR